MMTKEELREQICRLCQSLNTKFRSDAAHEFLLNLLPLLRPAKYIAVYRAYSWEADLKLVIDYALRQGKQLYQPLAYKNTKLMSLIDYSPGMTAVFSADNFIVQDCYKWYNLDLILVPLVAIDSLGIRLGKGGGYYDVTLAQIKRTTAAPILCGVGFECQLVNCVPSNVFDIKLDYFVCETGLTKF